jgi:hypothetical protein
MKLLGALLYGIGTIWTLVAMIVVWIPLIVHQHLPDAWIPDWFPSSGIELLPGWLQWIPFPEEFSMYQLVLANVVLAAPGVLLFFAGEKLRSEN